MPLINRIEVSNFMNVDRNENWAPTWPHAIFELLGRNSVINLPNGKGKTTIITTVLSMLSGKGGKMSGIKSTHFAPKHSGHYSHVRAQFTMDSESGAAFDMFTSAPVGEQMVFGVYGRSGENETYNYYAYHGTFEDCPVHRYSLERRGYLELVSDKDFMDRLQLMPGRFPTSARDKSKESWRDYMKKWFDMVSIEQQLEYQLKAGGEGNSSYFEVKPRLGMSYSAAVFYEHLAPQLLTNVMGEYGEEDEKGIEDTIHEKARQVVRARVVSEQRRRQLVQTKRLLDEMHHLSSAAVEISLAEDEFKENQSALASELAVLYNLVVDKPIPGLPLRPADNLPEVTKYLVLYEGQPYMPDRAFEFFTGDEAKVTNQRALRLDIRSADVDKSQVIDITCDLDFLGVDRKHTGGQPNKFYNLPSSIVLLEKTEKFLPEWDKPCSIDAVQKAFEWASSHADTNPARLQQNTIENERNRNKAEHAKIINTMESLSQEKTQLLQEQQQIDEHQSEFRRMQSSGLFKPEEMVAPEQTGQLVKDKKTKADRALSEHIQHAASLESVYRDWQEFTKEHGESVTPDKVLSELLAQEAAVKGVCEDIKSKRSSLTGQRKSLKATVSTLRESLNILTVRVESAKNSASAAEQFAILFPGQSPVGLDKQVTIERDVAHSEKNRIENDIAHLANMAKDLFEFRSRFGEDRDPGEWLKTRSGGFERVLSLRASLQGKLAETNISLSNLEKFSIAPHKYVLEVASNLGVDSIPLYQAVEQMGLGGAEKTKVLSLFSGLINAPVLPNVEQASIAARNLADKGYEFPVFVFDDLTEFCCTGQISFIGDVAKNLFVGVRTRAVDCLLDPSLVEREKDDCRKQITRMEKRLALLDRAKIRLSSESPASSLATRAQHAVYEGVVEKNSELAVQLAEVSSKLVGLEARASDAALAVIRGCQQHMKALGSLTLDGLFSEYEQTCKKFAGAESAEQENAEAIEQLSQQQEEAGENLRCLSVVTGTMEPVVKRICNFLSDSEHGPAFMHAEPGLRGELALQVEHAEKRCGFRFELAQKFVTSGENRPLEIEQRLCVISNGLSEMTPRKEQLLELVETQAAESNELIGSIHKIDQTIWRLLKIFRKNRNHNLTCPIVLPSRHEISIEASYIRAADIRELVHRLVKLETKLEDFGEDISKHAGKMATAARSYDSAKDNFKKNLDRVVQDSSLEMSSHVRHLLEESVSSPSKINVILAVTQSDYEKDTIANNTAIEQLDNEWTGMASWLSEFTKRLPNYFSIMKKVFAPQRDKLSREITHAGFEISGETADTDDIQAVMGELIDDIEVYETSQKRADKDTKKEAWKNYRKEIRNKFYQRIIPNPSIKVCIPSISKTPLHMESKMVSSGQGVAMTLLWIVKLADFISERERQKKTVAGSRYVSAAHLRKIRTIDSQFVFIDGAFSHLSDKNLIDDALKGISKTHGRFQLIVTGHDPDYNFKHNFEYFPTLITGRVISDRYMYIENNKPVEPGEAGSHYGAVDLIRLHKIKTVDEIAPAANAL